MVPHTRILLSDPRRAPRAATLLVSLVLGACGVPAAPVLGLVAPTVADPTGGPVPASDPSPGPVTPPSQGGPSQNPPVSLANALTPEQFGAVGDGVSDDTAALNALFAALNAEERPAVFAPGRVYRFGQTSDVQFKLVRPGTAVYGNGATLKVLDGESTSRRWFLFRIAARGVTVQDLTLDANPGARPAMTADVAQTSWFVDGGSRDVTLTRIRSLGAPVDGMYIRDLVSPSPVRDTALTPTNIRLENVELLNSGRNNLSIISSRNVTVSGGKFNGAGGFPGGPWAGIDIEPNGGVDLQGNDGVTVEGAETSDNAGPGFDVAQVGNHNIVVRDLRSDRNGAAMFLSPSGRIRVEGLRASGYGELTTSGVVAVVPSPAPGASVSFADIEINNVTDRRPAFFQNYEGEVALDGLRANRMAGEHVLGAHRPTAIANVYRDGVKIQ